jgi:hypothetical protein
VRDLFGWIASAIPVFFREVERYNECPSKIVARRDFYTERAKPSIDFAKGKFGNALPFEISRKLADAAAEIADVAVAHAVLLFLQPTIFQAAPRSCRFDSSLAGGAGKTRRHHVTFCRKLSVFQRIAALPLATARRNS